MSEILVDRNKGVVTLTLNRPERRNALTTPMFRELRRVIGEVERNRDDRVLLIRGAGGVFCSGGELSADEHGEGNQAQSSLAAHSLGLIRDEVGGAAMALHKLPKPTIAAVQGLAAGAGANLALGCDLVYAEESARFCEIFIRRALSIDCGGTWLLPRIVGLQRAKELTFFSGKGCQLLPKIINLVNNRQSVGACRHWDSLQAIFCADENRLTRKNWRKVQIF